MCLAPKSAWERHRQRVVSNGCAALPLLAHVWCALGVEHCASCVTCSAALDPLLSLQHMVEELLIQFVIRAQQFSSVCGHAQIVHVTLFLFKGD